MGLLVKPNRPIRQGEPQIGQLRVTTSKPSALGAGVLQNLFDVSGGPVAVTFLFGNVTTVIQTQTNNAQLNHVSDASESLAIASDLDITGGTVGTLFWSELDGTALVDGTEGGFFQLGAVRAAVLPVGKINVTYSATNTGVIEWYCGWYPIDPRGKVTRSATGANTVQASDSIS